MVNPLLDCPICGVPMISGNTWIDSTLLGFLFGGWGHLFYREHLWFLDEQGKTRVMTSNDAPAYRCSGCATVVILDDDWLIEHADAAERRGDVQRALQLYKIKARVGIDVDHARERIQVLKSEVKKSG